MSDLTNSLAPNFWTGLEQQNDRTKLEKYLRTELGEPQTIIQQNLYAEILQKISSYYFTLPSQASTIYSLAGLVTRLTQKLRKTGKHKGQTKFLMEVVQPAGKTILFQVYQENLPPEKWKQLTELTPLQQNLVCKYKKWITNHELLDFCLAPKTPSPEPAQSPIKPKGL